MIERLIQQDPLGVLLAALILLLGGVIVGGGVVVEMTTIRRRRLRVRLATLKSAVDGTPVDDGDGQQVVKENGGGRFARFQRMVVQAGGWRAMRLSVCLGIGAGLMVGAAALLIFLAGPVVSLVLAVGTGAAVYHHQMLESRRNRQLAFLEELPAAIDLIVRVVQAGLPVTDAITVAGTEIKGPVGTEFSAIAQLVQLGIDLKDALYEAANRLNLVDFDCFVVSLVVQRETGGQLSEILGNLSSIVRRRKETRAKAKGLTAEGRLTVKVVAALPFLTAGGLALISPRYMMPLITDPFGRHMLLAALACVGIGVTVVGRITKMEL